MSMDSAHLAALGRRIDEMPPLVSEERVVGDLAQLILHPSGNIRDESASTSVSRLAGAFIALQASSARLAAAHESMTREAHLHKNNSALFERRLKDREQSLTDIKIAHGRTEVKRESYAAEVRHLRRAVERALSRAPLSNKAAREHLAEADAERESRNNFCNNER